MCQLDDGFYDYAFEDVPASVLQKISTDVRPWFSSVAFCTLYAGQSAPRIALWVHNTEITEWCCFDEVHSRLLRKGVRIYGPVRLTFGEILTIIASRCANYATVIRQYESFIDGRTPFFQGGSRTALDDSVIALPDNAAAYLESLGRSTRKHLPYYLRRCERQWMERFKVLFLSKQDISIANFRSLVDLSRQRISNKGATHLLRETAVITRWQLAQKCGVMCAVLLDEQLIGGTLNYMNE